MLEQTIFRSPFLDPSQNLGEQCSPCKRAAQSQKAPPKLVPARKTSNDVMISLEPPMCRFVTMRFQLVESAHVATPPSPQDFKEISVHKDVSDTCLYYTHTTL